MAAATAAQVKTSGGKPAARAKPTPKPPVAAKTSAAVSAARRGGAPAVTLGGGPAVDVQPPEPVGAKLAPDELDLSSGALEISDEIAAGIKEGGQLDAKVRLPGLAEGSLHLRKRGTTFNSAGVAEAIVLRHPSLKRFAAVSPTTLVLKVKENKVDGWIGLGQPGPAKGDPSALGAALTKASDRLGWAGLSKINLPTFRNRFVDGALDAGVENLTFTVGGFLGGTGAFGLDNKGLSFDGSAKIEIPGGSSGELGIKQDTAGNLFGKLDLIVSVGSVTGTVTATLVRGFVSVIGSAGYTSDRLSGKITVAATDEATARDITKKKPDGGGNIPIELPGPDTPVKPGRRAFCGWGTLTFRINDWLAGSATVVVNNKGQATVIGEIAPPKEFILFQKKPWKKNIFDFKVKAGYGIPVVGQVGVFAGISLDAIAEVGPGILKDIKLSGVYSTDPGVPKSLSLEGTINISAYAGLELAARAGLFLTILSHDIEAGVKLTASAGVRGYVEARPKIGMREPVPGKREYYIQGHMEIAAEPVLAFGGKLYVSIDTPWWSPLSDKTWEWPLFETVYPLPGEFGIGADVDYVLGSKKWPEIEFGEVAFDGDKFLSDVMNDNTDKGRGGDRKQPGDWEEGLAKGGPGGAKNKPGSGKTPGDMDDGIGPIGDRESFSDGGETHEIWFEQKGTTAQLLMASGSPAPLEKKLDGYQKAVGLLLEADRKKAQVLLDSVRKQDGDLREKANQLASMKMAARHAKEVNEKNKGKGRKKAGVKKGKDGGKELAKQVRAAEKALRLQLKTLAEMLRDVQFKAPLAAKPAVTMAHGKKEEVALVDRKSHVGLEIAKKPDTQELALILAGVPFTEKLVSTTGKDLVTGSQSKIDPLAKTIAAIPTQGGRINAKLADTLPKQINQIGAVVARIGRDLDIPSLERARQFLPIDKEKLPPLRFKPRPRKSHKAYVDAFVAEMKRQISDQERGINQMSVDQWTSNLTKFALDPRGFTALDAKGRAKLFGVLDERSKNAKARIGRGLKSASTQIENLEEKDGLTEKEEKRLGMVRKTRARGPTRKASLRAAVEEIAAARVEERVPDARVLKPAFDDGKDQGLRLRSRQGGERGARKSIPKEDLQELLAREIAAGNWAGLVDEHDTSGIALLHQPDQVAGGYDEFSELPERPPNRDDPDEWQAYLDKLKKFFGPKVINGDIGTQWSKELIYTKALNGVRKVVRFKASYPLHRLNLTLLVDPPS